MEAANGGLIERATVREHLVAVWGLPVVVAAAIVVTYARLPASEFYHVSHEGLQSGFGRALVYSNFPVAIIGFAMIGVALILLREYPRRGLLTAAGTVGALCCLVTAVPGVVDHGDLDAKPINVVPFAGVLIAMGLTLLAIRAPEAERTIPWSWKDRFGLGLLAVLVVLGLPWILADLGFYVGDIPGLGSIYYSKQLPEDGGTLRAVHLGNHHGMDGIVLTFAAFALGRVVRHRQETLAKAVAIFLGLMLSYALFNLANDLWLEQVVKRGWTEREIPNELVPDLTIGWGIIVAGAALAWWVLFRPEPSAVAETRTDLAARMARS